MMVFDRISVDDDDKKITIETNAEKKMKMIQTESISCTVHDFIISLQSGKYEKKNVSNSFSLTG